MQAGIKSKLVLTLITMILVTSAIAVPLSSSMLYSHAAPLTSQGSWNIVPNPYQNISYSNLLGTVTISVNDVWAVGYDNSSGNDLTMHWDGSSWTTVTSPNAIQSVLYSVTAISSNDVWAVGRTNIPNTINYETLIIHWDGLSWTRVTSPSPGSYNTLSSVTAASSNDVWAVGFDSAGGALTMHWDGSSWTTVASPDAIQNTLNSITAISSNDVWAVGQTNAYQTLTMHWDGSSWTTVASPNLSNSTLNSVTAVSSNDVWAVGTTHSGTLSGALIEQYTVSMTPTPSPSPQPSPNLVATVTLNENTCLNTVNFTLQNATADQFRISRDGLWEAQLKGNATSYTETTVADAPYGYNIYEIAALMSKHVVALTRIFVPNTTLCDLNPPSNSAPVDPIAGSENDLFVIIGGISSKLPTNSLGGLVNNGYGYDPGFLDFGDNTKVASYLMWHGYLDSRFIVFSYTGYTQDGMPKGYDCKYTYDGSSFFQKQVQKLGAQIQAAVASNPNVRVHILAHSQGGVIALSYVAALVKNLDGVTPLPQLKDVSLLDSPVGGTIYNSGYLTNMVLKAFSCNTASQFNNLKEMHKLFITASDTNHRGQTASVVDAFLSGNPLDSTNANQAVVDLAHQKGITVFVAGNMNDYLWQPHGCITKPDFLSTEFIQDEGDNSGVYSRYFKSGIPDCLSSLPNLLNHLEVLSYDAVNQAVFQIVQGQAPTALPPYNS